MTYVIWTNDLWIRYQLLKAQVPRSYRSNTNDVWILNQYVMASDPQSFGFTMNHVFWLLRYCVSSGFNEIMWLILLSSSHVFRPIIVAFNGGSMQKLGIWTHTPPFWTCITAFTVHFAVPACANLKFLLPFRLGTIRNTWSLSVPLDCGCVIGTLHRIVHHLTPFDRPNSRYGCHCLCLWSCRCYWNCIPRSLWLLKLSSSDFYIASRLRQIFTWNFTLSR